MTRGETAWLDGIQIAVRDVRAASLEYARLLGMEPLELPSGARRFQLGRGAIEIEAGDQECGLRSLRFAVAAGRLELWAARVDFHGLEVRATPVVQAACDAERPGPTAMAGLVVADDAAPAVARDTASAAVRDTAPAADCIHAIDHVVVHTAAAERAVRLWRDALGVRLALDREFPARGLRMLFFRSGGVTLEMVSPLGACSPTSRDRLHGLAYAVRDLAAARARLERGGIEVSPARPGHKPGTQVATVRSGTAGVPTLLIEHPDR